MQTAFPPAAGKRHAGPGLPGRPPLGAPFSAAAPVASHRAGAPDACIWRALRPRRGHFGRADHPSGAFSPTGSSPETQCGRKTRLHAPHESSNGNPQAHERACALPAAPAMPETADSSRGPVIFIPPLAAGMEQRACEDRCVIFCRISAEMSLPFFQTGVRSGRTAHAGSVQRFARPLTGCFRLPAPVFRGPPAAGSPRAEPAAWAAAAGRRGAWAARRSACGAAASRSP